MEDIKRPRVLLFDIGGVVLASPFHYILEFEKTHSIPRGYINFAISRNSPDGAWNRLERGELRPEAEFFRVFRSELERESVWRAFWQQPARRPRPGSSSDSIPPVPRIDAEALFWSMMTALQHPEPEMVSLLHTLRGLPPPWRPFLAALSNTVHFPPNAPIHEVDRSQAQVRGLFDLFISSAEIGMRKPEKRIYVFTMQRLRQQIGQDLVEGEVLFVDDVGQNLKAAREMGMRTLKAGLGETQKVVGEIKKVIGLDAAARTAKL